MSFVRVFMCFHADFACVVVVATRSSRLCFVVSILLCCAFFLFYFEFAVRACCSYAVHIFLFVYVRLSCVSRVFFFYRPRRNRIIWCSYYYDLCLRALIFLLSIVHVMVFNIMMLFDFVSCVLYVAVFLFIIYMCHVSLVV